MPARSLANSVTYSDSAGGDATAPDITTVTVSNTDASLLTFQISIPNRPAFTSDMWVQIGVDSDNSAATGSDGTDYLIDASPIPGQGTVVGLYHWNGAGFYKVAAPTLGYSYASGATFRIGSTDLGGTKQFGFVAVAASGVVWDASGNNTTANAHFDSAPDSGSWVYALQVSAPTPPTTPTKSPSLAS
ncbi:MAG: hypothetical protein ACXVZP_07415, partial [Gaiellaceae bacterium]